MDDIKSCSPSGGPSPEDVSLAETAILLGLDPASDGYEFAVLDRIAQLDETHPGGADAFLLGARGGAAEGRAGSRGVAILVGKDDADVCSLDAPESLLDARTKPLRGVICVRDREDALRCTDETAEDSSDEPRQATEGSVAESAQGTEESSEHAHRVVIAEMVPYYQLDGAALRATRKGVKMTQVRLAAETGIDRRRIVGIEKGGGPGRPLTEEEYAALERALERAGARVGATLPAWRGPRPGATLT